MTTARPKIPVEDLVVGTRYRVVFDDCCAQGHFTDTLTEVRRFDDGSPDCLVFEGAEIGPSWGQWHVEPAEDEARP